MSMTLLEMTQKILSSMDSDEVNAISDSTEALQVAHIIQDSYEYLLSSIELPEHYNFFELVASGNAALPNMMYLPSNCDELLYLKYDVMETDLDTLPRPAYIDYVEPYEFFDRMHLRDQTSPDVAISYVPFNNEFFPCYYYTDRHPSEYTAVNDRTLIFDAVHVEEDTTLQKAKTIGYGKLRPDFELVDSFVPALNNKQFSLLFNEAKSQAFMELKQQANPISERRARKGWIKTQVNKHSVKDPYENYNNFMSFGRRRR